MTHPAKIASEFQQAAGGYEKDVAGFLAEGMAALHVTAHTGWQEPLKNVANQAELPQTVSGPTR